MPLHHVSGVFVWEMFFAIDWFSVTIRTNNQGDKKMKLNSLDFKIVVSVMFCIVSAWLITFLGILPASFSALLCVREEGLTSKKSGYYWILATLIGGLAAVLLIYCYHFIPSKITLFCLLMLAILGTLYVSKSVALPPFLARIAVLTLLIVAIMGKGDLLYAANRLLSTIYGAIVAWGI